MTEFLSTHWLDIVTTILGLIYLVLEYRASIALWVVGNVMPAMDIYLYWSHGLYGDAGMAVYYTLAAIYGYAVWKFGAKWKRMLKRKASGVAGSDKALDTDGSDKAVDVAGSDKAVDAVGGSSEELPITFFPRRLILRAGDDGEVHDVVHERRSAKLRRAVVAHHHRVRKAKHNHTHLTYHDRDADGEQRAVVLPHAYRAITRICFCLRCIHIRQLLVGQ